MRPQSGPARALMTVMTPEMVLACPLRAPVTTGPDAACRRQYERVLQ